MSSLTNFNAIKMINYLTGIFAICGFVPSFTPGLMHKLDLNFLIG